MCYSSPYKHTLFRCLIACELTSNYSVSLKAVLLAPAIYHLLQLQLMFCLIKDKHYLDYNVYKRSTGLNFITENLSKIFVSIFLFFKWKQIKDIAFYFYLPRETAQTRNITSVEHKCPS